MAGVGLSVFLTSCDKEDVLPVIDTPPATGTPGGGTGSGTPPATPPATPPVTPTPPPTSPTTPPVTTPPAPVTASSLLKQLGSRQFKYDAQNRLVEVAYLQQEYLGFKVVYEGDRPVRLNKNTGGWVIYTYEGDKVVEATSYYGEGLVNYWYKFEYSGNLLVKKTSISYARSDEGQLGVATYKYDANGNIIEYAVRWSTNSQEANLSNPSYIRWGSYDSQPNPEPYISDGIYLPGVKWSVNNPGYRDPGYGKEIFSYIRHDSGMPMKRYTKLEAYPHVQPSTDEYSYY
ncbi:hypothetical protein H8S95_03065 [Pontibacter sp. KCTC 32443]|nr:hypothetical protein [Pontibacter sp. KCTC 32443]